MFVGVPNIMWADVMSMRAIEPCNISMYVFFFFFFMRIVPVWFAYAHAKSNSKLNANISDPIGMHTQKFRRNVWCVPDIVKFKLLAWINVCALKFEIAKTNIMYLYLCIRYKTCKVKYQTKERVGKVYIHS